MSERVEAVLTTIPAKPGCYLMKNAAAGIIYVGKAVNLRNRVRSYFHADAGHDAKTFRRWAEPPSGQRTPQGPAA